MQISALFADILVVGANMNEDIQLSDVGIPVARDGVNGELFLASYFKVSYFGELFLCKLDYLK